MAANRARSLENLVPSFVSQIHGNRRTDFRLANGRPRLRAAIRRSPRRQYSDPSFEFAQKFDRSIPGRVLRERRRLDPNRLGSERSAILSPRPVHRLSRLSAGRSSSRPREDCDLNKTAILVAVTRHSVELFTETRSVS